MENNAIKYDAFISYRHKELDTAVAKELHRQIETYRIPAYIRKKTDKRKMGKVFRDQDELPLMTNLGEGILQALDASEWLIVICSPDLPKSKWCMAEIDHFIETGKQDKILTVLIAGEPHESFPPELMQRTLPDGSTEETEPLAADLRDSTKEGIIKKIRTEKLRLLAPMLGVGYDELKRRQRERFLRNVTRISAAVAIVTVFASVYVLWQNQRLEEQRNIAYQNEAWALKEREDALISQSKFLSGMSSEMLNKGNPAIAALLALEALPEDMENPSRPVIDEAVTALRNVSISKTQGDFLLAGGLSSSWVSWNYFEKENVFMVYLPEYPYPLSKVQFYNMKTGELLCEINVSNMLSFSYNEGISKIALSSYMSDDPIKIVDLNTFDIREVKTEKSVSRVYLPSAGKYLLYGVEARDTTYIEVMDLDSEKVLYHISEEELFPWNEERELYDSYIGDFVASPDGNYVAAAYGRMPEDEPAIKLFNLKDYSEVLSFEKKGDIFYRYLQFSPDGKYLSAHSGKSGVIDLYSVETGKLIRSFGEIGEEDELSQNTAYFSPDSKFIAIHTFNGRVFVYKTQTWEQVLENDVNLGPIVFFSFMDNSVFAFRRGLTSPDITMIGLNNPAESDILNIPDLYSKDMLAGSDKAGVYLKSIQADHNSIVCFTSTGVYQLWTRNDDSSDEQSFEDVGVKALNEKPFGTAEVYDIETVKCFSPDGSKFAVSQSGDINIYDTNTLELLFSITKGSVEGTKYVLPQIVFSGQILWSPDGNKIISVDNVGNVKVIDAVAGIEMYQIDTQYTASPFTPLAIPSPDWSCFALNNPAHNGGIYDMLTGERRFELENNGSMGLTAGGFFSKDSKQFTYQFYDEEYFAKHSVEPGVYLVTIDAATGDFIEIRKGSIESMNAVSPDYSHIVMQNPTSKKADFVSLETIETVWSTEIDPENIIWSNNGKFVIFKTAYRMETSVLDIDTGEVIYRFAADNPHLSEDDRYLSMRTTGDEGEKSTNNQNYKGLIFDLESGTEFATLPSYGIVSPDKKIILMQNTIMELKPLSQIQAEVKEWLGSRVLSDEEKKQFFIN